MLQKSRQLSCTTFCQTSSASLMWADLKERYLWIIPRGGPQFLFRQLLPAGNLLQTFWERRKRTLYLKSRIQTVVQRRRVFAPRCCQCVFSSKVSCCWLALTGTFATPSPRTHKSAAKYPACDDACSNRHNMGTWESEIFENSKRFSVSNPCPLSFLN